MTLNHVREGQVSDRPLISEQNDRNNAGQNRDDLNLIDMRPNLLSLISQNKARQAQSK